MSYVKNVLEIGKISSDLFVGCHVKVEVKLDQGILPRASMEKIVDGNFFF